MNAASGSPRPKALPPKAEFPWYLAGSSAWLAAMTVQTYLVQWLLVFHLDVEAMEFGASRALMEVPPLAMLLLGGLFADRFDGRKLLMALGLAACLPPLAMAAGVGRLEYWTIIAFGIAMALLQTASDPARAAMMNRVTRLDIQRTVALTTFATTLVGIGAYQLAGRLEALGLVNVLLIQAGLFVMAAAAAGKLSPQPQPLPVASPALGADLVAGLRALWQAPLVRDIIGINFASALFNAGAYIVVLPLVVRDVYAGDGAFLANMFTVFTIGSTSATLLLFFLMPLRRPGRVFLLMQTTRIAILLGLWLAPPTWLFFALILAWGVNMGVTTTVVRTTVQELAPEAHRAKILAILIASFMVASPVSALILGAVAALGEVRAGLLPGVFVSLAILIVGVFGTGLWRFEPPSSRA